MSWWKVSAKGCGHAAMLPCWPGCHSSRAETMWVSQGNNECFHTLPWKLSEQPSHQLRACFSLEWPLSNLTFQLFFWILFPFRHLAVAPAKEAGIKMALEWVMGLRSWISHPWAWRHIPYPQARSLCVSFSCILLTSSLLSFLHSRFNGPSLHGHVSSLSHRLCFWFWGWLFVLTVSAQYFSIFPFSSFKLLCWFCLKRD